MSRDNLGALGAVFLMLLGGASAVAALRLVEFVFHL